MTRFLPAAVALLALLVGCGRPSSHSDEASHEHVEDGVTFSSKHGLRVAPHTAAFLGLKVAEVEERVVTAEFGFTAQIYGRTRDTQMASGDVSPEQARLLQRGQAVTIEAEGPTLLGGRISEIDPHTDKATVDHWDVSVTIDGQLAPGTFVTVKVPRGGTAPVTSIPRSALLETAEGKFVYTASGEHFVRTAVKTGTIGTNHVEITDGLYSGDSIVVTPVMALWMAELQSVRGGKACADGH